MMRRLVHHSIVATSQFNLKKAQQPFSWQPAKGRMRIVTESSEVEAWRMGPGPIEQSERWAIV